MGLYDRDYLRDDDEPTGFGPRAVTGPQTVVAKLVIINVAIWLVDLFTNGKLRELLTLRSDVLSEPWKLYQLLGYAFAHDGQGIMHLLFNMFGLWSFGQMLEQRYGPREFLRFYLASALLGGVVFVLHHLVTGTPASVIGASGAVNAVVILFALLYPQTQILVMFVIPMKIWVAAILFVLFDLTGLGGQRTNVAHDVHLAGAAFAVLYHYNHWNLTHLTGGINLDWLTKLTKSRPKLRVFSEPNPADIEARVDAILQKISEQGEASLTKAERKTLEDASRRYQKRKP
ncbi:MAG: rhomboid family intramembrane serine protease [Planctomycetaceae bacterium]|nr:rhomboid family intramembrane serine protease [Planctomycetaceae bacterium]